MSYLQVTAFRSSLRVSDRYNAHHGSAIQCISPVNICNLHTSLKPTIGSSNKCTKLMTRHMIQRTGASRYQQCQPVCLFGGKGESKNGNEASPWKSIEKAMSGLKKEQSLEDVLRQQMEKQDYYDGGSGGDPPTGGGGGGGGGFGGTEDEGWSGILDDIVQVTCAILALIVLYVYVIAGEHVMPFLTDCFDFLAGKRGPRIRTIMQAFARFYQQFRAKESYDPYWLEKAIISTPTCWDSPKKYRRMLRSAQRMVNPSEPTFRPSRRNIRSKRRAIDSDDDDKAYSNDDDNDDNAYNEDDDGDF